MEMNDAKRIAINNMNRPLPNLVRYKQALFFMHATADRVGEESIRGGVKKNDRK